MTLGVLRSPGRYFVECSSTGTYLGLFSWLGWGKGFSEEGPWSKVPSLLIKSACYPCDFSLWMLTSISTIKFVSCSAVYPVPFGRSHCANHPRGVSPPLAGFTAKMLDAGDRVTSYQYLGPNASTCQGVLQQREFRDVESDERKNQG